MSFNLWLMFLVVILRKSKEGIKKQEKTLLFTFKISFSGIAIMSSPAATSGYLNKKKNYTKLRATKWNRRFFSIEEGNLNWRNIPCSRIKDRLICVMTSPSRRLRKTERLAKERRMKAVTMEECLL